MNEILECGHPPTPQPKSSITTGYGTAKDGKRSCFECCANDDRRWMEEHGEHDGLYLVRRANQHYVVNWPGSLEFRAFDVMRRPHAGGFGAQRTDAWFVGPDGWVWHAVNRGDNDVARCKRTKREGGQA